MAKKTFNQSHEFDIASQNPLQVNVRQDVNDKSLRPVGSPKLIGSAPGTLLGVVPCDGRDVVVSALDGRVYLADPSKNGPVEVASLDWSPTACVNTGDSLLLTTDFVGQPPLKLKVDFVTGDASVEEPLPRHGAPRLVRVDDGVITRPIPERQLKGSYSRTDRSLLPDDLHAVTADFADAYCDACNLAAGRHRYLQPVMARITARDARGIVVYRSAPVLIAPATGAQMLSAERALTGDGFNVAGAVTLHAVPFSIGIRFPSPLPEAWRKRVATLEVETSEQIHPVNLALPSAVRIEGTDTAGAKLSVSAPGVDTLSADIAGDGSEMRRRVEGILAHAGDAFAVARSISFPAMVDGGTVTGIYRSAAADCRKQVAAVMALASRPIEKEQVSPAPWQMNYPHSFSAACGAAGSGAVLWGTITTRLFNGYTVAEQSTAVSISTVPMPATSIVTLADGRRLVDSVTETSAIPAELSPLIVYPHPSAVKVTILAGTKKWEAALRPTPCRRMAYFLAADLRPVTPDEETGMHLVPEGDEVTERYPSTVAIAPVANPLEVVATAAVGTATVTAITPELRAGSSLDITRRHFYAFTRSGIFSVTAGGAAMQMTAVKLDHRPVMMAQSVAAGTDEILVVAGGDLLSVTGNKVTTMLVNAGPCIVGKCSRHNEIWLVSAADDPTMIYNPVTKYAFYRNDVYPEEMLSCDGRLLLHTADGSLLDSSSELDSPMPVEITLRYNLPRARAVTGLGVRLFSSNFEGKIILAADNGIHSPDGAYRIVDFDVTGALNRPLESRLIAHPFRYVTFGIRATVSPDTRLESVTFTTR